MKDIKLSVMSHEKAGGYALLESLADDNDIVLSWEMLFNLFPNLKEYDWKQLLELQRQQRSSQSLSPTTEMN